MFSIDTWKRHISDDSVKAIDKNQIIAWYANADNQSENPGRFLGLDEQTKRRFEFVNKMLLADNSVIKGDYDQIKAVLDNLNLYFNAIDNTSQKHELVLFDLINQVYRDKINFIPKFDLKKQFPKFEAHFKTEKLEILNFGDFFRASTNTYSTVNFICAFRQIITKDVIEKLDKAAEIDDTNKSTNSSFAYQSELEFCYLSLIIKMITSTYLDHDLNIVIDNSINNWLNNYPFRILNSKGDFTPDNFFISANNYIRKESADIKGRLQNYFDFFNRLKNTRTPAKVTIVSAVDFLDLYDASINYDKGTMEAYKPTIPLRSVYFREDFDYLNSLLIRGINLNRKFWIAVDKIVEEKKAKLGLYLLLANTIKGLDEFYNSIANDLGLKNGFTQDMADRMERYKTICETSDENLKLILKDFGLKEKYDEVEAKPDVIDIIVLTEMDYNKYLNKNIAYVSKEIVTYKDGEYKMHIEHSSNSKIILRDDGTERTYNYCYGSNNDLCNVIGYHDLRININSSESSIKEPIFKVTYNKPVKTKTQKSGLDISKITEKLIKDVVDRKVRIYWVYFTLKKHLDDTTVLTVKIQFDVINSDPVSIKNLCDTFTEHDTFYLISFDYGKLPDETKPIPKPELREDTFQERMAEIKKRQDKLQNETLVIYRQEIANIIYQGQQQIDFQEQLLADARARELDASDEQRAQIASIKKAAKDAIAKIKGENEAKQAANNLLLKEAQAELLRLKELSKKLNEERVKARADSTAALKAEAEKRQEEEKAATEAKELAEEIESNNDLILKGFNRMRINRKIFDRQASEFLKKYKEFEKLESDLLNAQKIAYDKAVRKADEATGEQTEERDSITLLYTQLKKLKSEDVQDKDIIKRDSLALRENQQICQLMFEDVVEEGWVEKIEELQELNKIAKKVLESKETLALIKAKADADASLAAAASAAPAPAPASSAASATSAASPSASSAASPSASSAASAASAAFAPSASAAPAPAPAPGALASSSSSSVPTAPAQLEDEEAGVNAKVEAEALAAQKKAEEAAAAAKALKAYPEFNSKDNNAWIRRPTRDEKAKLTPPSDYIEVSGWYYKRNDVILPEAEKPEDESQWDLKDGYYFKKFLCKTRKDSPPGYKFQKDTKICVKE